MDKKTSILLIEDNPGDAGLIRHMLNNMENRPFTLNWKDSMKSGIEAIKDFDPDVILLDMELPDSHGQETFDTICTYAPDIPIVILSGLGDDKSTIKQVLQKGAQDYLIKGQVDKDLLTRSVYYSIDRKKSEQKIKDALNIKSEFVSMVSHELRTPLTAIKEGIGIVIDGQAGSISEEQHQYLEIAKRNVDRLARLINNVLTFQKLESGKISLVKQPNNINQVIEEVIQTMKPLAKEKSLKIITDCLPDIPEFMFDRDSISQVITNLLNNAIKFTSQGQIAIKTDIEDDSVLISVRDTGIGIHTDKIPRLFQKFEQLSDGQNRMTGGSGLGLAISKKIINKHQGNIWLESEIHQGSVFTFMLPMRKPDIQNDSSKFTKGLVNA